MTRSEYRKLLMERCPRDPYSGKAGCATAAWCPVIKDEMPELPQPPWECSQIIDWRGYLILGMPTAEFLQKLEEEDGDGDDADCIERLRLQANAVEESGRLLLADCARVLRQRVVVRGQAWDEACMGLSMAREALETAGWWLRRCAEDMEDLNGRDGEQAEVRGVVPAGQGAEEGQ